MPWCASLAITLVLAGVAAGVPAAGGLRVEPDATVSADVIRLREVAALEGAAEALGDTVLGRAPMAGETRVLDGAAVLAALKQGGLDPARVTYTIPPVVRVRRASQDVSEAAVRQAIEAFLVESLGAGAADAVVRSVELPQPIRVPAGPFALRVTPPSDTALLGRVHLPVTVVVNDRPVRTAWVTADVARYGPVVTVRRPLARGEVLAADDVVVDRRDLTLVPRDALTNPEEAVGRMTRVALLPNVPLRRDAVAPAAVVQRGDVVLLIVERGGLKITVPGELREDGARGEQVRVVNRSSQKEVLGRVVDASTVVVDF